MNTDHVKAQLQRLDGELDKAAARMTEARADAKDAVRRRIEDLRALRDCAASEAEKLEAAGTDAADAARKRADALLRQFEDGVAALRGGL